MDLRTPPFDVPSRTDGARSRVPPVDFPTANGGDHMERHNALLGELANDAALERSDFIVQATEQLLKFLDHHRDRIASIGGLTLIDEEPDYLSIAPDLSFRSRSRFVDEATGEWVSETEVI